MNTVNGSVISQYAYGNDALGRCVSLAKSGSMMKSAETIACGYDARSELVSAVSEADPAYDYAYGFDAAGNRETYSESLGFPNTLFPERFLRLVSPR